MVTNIKLEELIDVNVLQEIQDIFAKSTRVAAITVDYEGKPVTVPSNFTDFCTELRKNPKWRDKCYKCDAYGGIQSLINRAPHIYKCHAGLYDFSVPIVIDNNYVGAIMGGQAKLIDEDECDEKTGAFGKLSKWSGDKLINYYDYIEEKKFEDLESAAYLIYKISTYMVEHEFVNMIKKELIDKQTELMEEENRRISLEKALKESELKALQYQINPHFMFNALNTIQNLAYLENAPKTQDIIHSFSDLIKYSLRNEDTNTTYLYDEINYVESYMNIQKARFGNKINYSIDIDKKYYDIKCPFMILQPILENFVKYVVEKSVDIAEIKIKGYENNDDLVIEIMDNGEGISTEKIRKILEGYDYKNKGECIGLYNINQRLIGLYGKEYGLEMYSANFKATGLITNIRIPMIEVKNDV